MHLTLAAIAKNEGQYIEEWLAHHSIIGFDHIVIMDNGSTDDMVARIQGCSFGVSVDVAPWVTVEGISTQMACYNHVLKKYGGKTDAIAFIDLDEFIVEVTDKKFRDIVSPLLEKPECGAIVLNQRVFGSNGQENITLGPVLERFAMGSESSYVENEWVKSIYKCKSIGRIVNSHSSPLLDGQHYQPSGQVAQFKSQRFATETTDHTLLQLNHYITKSFEEFLLKRQRGGVMASTDEARRARYADDGFFRNRQYGANKVFDDATKRAANLVKALVKESDTAD